VINKKGISPLIATVLLIGFTIVLAALVIRWGSELVTGLTKEEQCNNEGLIECTSNVDLIINTADLDSTSNPQNVDLSLTSNGKKDITEGWIVRIHKDSGEVIAENLAGIIAGQPGANQLLKYSTVGFEVAEDPVGDPWGIIRADATAIPPIPLGTDFDDCDDKFCGISVIPKIKHTTDKGDSCIITCGQSEKRKTFDSIT